VSVPTAAPPRLKVGDLLARKGDPLQLEILTGEVGLEREIRSPEASSPGLVLAGYTARFLGVDRLHILGETEITYLASLDAKARRVSIDTFLSYALPCIIITKAQEAPEELLVLARERGIPVIRTRLKTAEFYRRLKPFLDDAFAPRTTCTARSPMCSAWACCSAGAPESARASACSTSWSAGTGSSPTTSSTSRGGARRADRPRHEISRTTWRFGASA
jgi:hypothetical protein